MKKKKKIKFKVVLIRFFDPACWCYASMNLHFLPLFFTLVNHLIPYWTSALSAIFLPSESEICALDGKKWTDGNLVLLNKHEGLSDYRSQDLKTKKKILLFVMASFQHITRSLTYIHNYFSFWTAVADGCIKYQHKARFILPELWCLLEEIKIRNDNNGYFSSFSVCA